MATAGGHGADEASVRTVKRNSRRAVRAGRHPLCTVALAKVHHLPETVETP